MSPASMNSGDARRLDTIAVAGDTIIGPKNEPKKWGDEFRFLEPLRGDY